MAKSLKVTLRQNLTADIAALEQRLANTKAALAALDGIETKKATYVVRVNSYWADHGEKSTETRFTGTLKDAMAQAERDFMKANSRSDVQGGYYVGIALGELVVNVPDDFYKEFIGGTFRKFDRLYV
jgi:hypothetical protein